MIKGARGVRWSYNRNAVKTTPNQDSPRSLGEEKSGAGPQKWGIPPRQPMKSSRCSQVPRGRPNQAKQERLGTSVGNLSRTEQLRNLPNEGRLAVLIASSSSFYDRSIASCEGNAACDLALRICSAVLGLGPSPAWPTVKPGAKRNSVVHLPTCWAPSHATPCKPQTVQVSRLPACLGQGSMASIHRHRLLGRRIMSCEVEQIMGYHCCYELRPAGQARQAR